MIVIIIQARMGSSRLPGKVLMKINHQSVLENLVERVSPVKHANKIVIATTTNPEDDAIETLCKQKNWICSRGSDWDVLSRYYEAAIQFADVSHVVRLTSDCPLNHYSVIDKVIEQCIERGVDYFSNSNNEPDYIEDGFDVEVFTFKSLEEAWKEAKLLSEREHVTPYIKNCGKNVCGWMKTNVEYVYKLSVDTPEDFAAVASIFEHLKDKQLFSMEDVIKLLQKHPEILEKNKNSVPNSGYVKSLNNDKLIS